CHTLCCFILLFSSMLRPPPTSTLFPYTTLFRSSQTAATSATFSGAIGHTYAFYSVVTDNASNVQPTPGAAQASTTVANPNPVDLDRKSTRLNSSHRTISYAVFCLKKKKITYR